jgi:hypothetical protein
VASEYLSGTIKDTIYRKNQSQTPDNLKEKAIDEKGFSSSKIACRGGSIRN